MRKSVIGISGGIMIDDEELIRGQLQVVDALLLLGGHDVNPIL